MLEVRGLTTAFGELRAVDDVSLDVRAGTVTGLIGPNGAGKTTLFHSITGVTPPDRGEIRLAGSRIDRLGPEALFRRGLAHTFQIPRPFPDMSVLENLMVAPTGQSGESFLGALLTPGKVAREEASIRAKAHDILAYTTLDAVAGLPAGRLSGGQMKLLELARVLMGDPRVILLDEPTAGVSPSLTDVLAEKIAELNRRGLTFFIIEHDMDFVMRHCDPIIGMAGGKVIFEGGAGAARADPLLLDAYLGGSEHG